MKYLTIFENEKVLFAFTNKEAGNMSYARAEDEKEVTRARKELANDFAIKMDSIIYLSQVHGNNIVLAYKDNIKGDYADGIITNSRAYSLATIHADCLPVYFYDKANNAIGLAHSGWKGTLLRIPSLMVERMKSEYGTKEEDLKVFIGPSISFESFEVQEDLYSSFLKEFPQEEDLIKKDRIDLQGLVKAMLIEKGLKKEMIEDIGLCTYKEEDLFFSHRRATKRGEKLEGAMLALAFLKE